MASIKVSELPAVTAFTSTDVLIINDENTTTSSITLAYFLGSLSGQAMTWTNTTAFNAATTFGASSSPTFNDAATFNGTITLNGAVTLGAAAQIPLNALSDVTINASPTDGYVLTYDTTTSQWVPEITGSMNELKEDTTPQLGGNLDTNDFYITNATGNVTIDPPSDGKFVIYGDTTRGSGGITFNDEQNDGTAVEIKAPSHANLSTSYTLTLPNNIGTSGQVLSTDGTTQSSWVSALQKNVNNAIPEYADDTAAATGGVVVGGIYHTSGALKVRVS